MAMSDPFSTTYQGTMAAKESLGQGISDAAGAVGQGMVGAAQQKQQQKQMQQMMGLVGLGKKTGAIKDETTPLTADEYNAQAEAMIQKAGPSIFKSNTVLTGSDKPEERMQQYQQLFKAAGMPGPKTTKTTTTVDADKLTQAQKMGWSWNAKDGVTFHSQEVSPEAQAMQSLAMDSKKQSMEKSQEDEFSTADKLTNPLSAPTRSALGVLGSTSLRADRALDLLSDPKITKSSQVMNAATADLSGILQGGAPTVEAMGEQSYNTLASTWAKAQQFAQSQPESAMPKDIMDQLNEELVSLKNTGRSYVKNNLEINDASPFAQNNPDTWAKMRAKIKDKYIDFKQDPDDDSTASGPSSNGAQSVLNAAGMGSGNQQSKWSLVTNGSSQ